MYDNPDPTDRALASLRSQHWTGEPHKVELEEKLMKMYRAKNLSFHIGQHRVLTTLLAVLLIGGVGFAAAGGVEAVKTLFVTVRLLGPNGEVYETIDVEPIEYEDGAATAVIDMGDGQQATLELQKVDPEELLEDGSVAMGEEMAVMTITLDGPPAGAHRDGGTEQTIDIDMLATTETDEPMDQTSVLQQIAQAELVIPWVDNAGQSKELYLVRDTEDDTGTCFKIFCSRELDSGEKVFDMIAMVPGVFAQVTDVSNIEVDEYGVTTMTFLFEDGQERTLKFNTASEGVHGGADRVEIHLHGKQAQQAHISFEPSDPGEQEQ